MFLRRRPSAAEIEMFRSRCSDSRLSYRPVGMTANPPRGFHLDQASIVLGHGASILERARSGLEAWRHFDLAWLEIFPKGAPLEPGTDVVVLARHFGFWSLNACRVVYRFGSATGSQLGYAYGTLREHAATGEEVFKVSMDDASGEVLYEIRAVSRPRAALAWIGYPLTRALQARFRRDSTAAMRGWIEKERSAHE